MLTSRGPGVPGMRPTSHGRHGACLGSHRRGCGTASHGRAWRVVAACHLPEGSAGATPGVGSPPAAAAGQDSMQRFAAMLDRKLNPIKTSLQEMKKSLHQVESFSAILVEAVAGRALRDREQQKQEAASVVLKDAASVVNCVLPPGLPPHVHEVAAGKLAAWLVEEDRGLRAILESELRAVPSRLTKKANAQWKAAAASAAQAALAILQGAACDQQNYSPALDALKCCADRLPVSLQLLETYATSDRDTALALMRGELCVAALTALHPLSSGEASSTATQLQVDRLLPLRVCAEAGGGKGGSHGRSGSGSGDGDGDGGSTSGPRVGPGVTAVLEIQEIKSSSAGLPTARAQVARCGRIFACVYSVLRERLSEALANAEVQLPPTLRLQATIALGQDGEAGASEEQRPPQLELSTADGGRTLMQMQYLVLAAETLVPWVPGRQQ
ncbi:hypothetical protein CHLRE_01g060347v5 [Chlamydomonas reinhardtii]|uniref:Uncharacterized protein n=1 Tax=Chlamydomonas reinhardtii TaxID=3055 RepID=A0A2K3E8F9_CHLRE|nr:uncharacterized protein CHLRE_01g060347v5 [Chlamydomonas reinhardtii]PNW89066.1 hypothetical protein CHLRE_01g060347v5 [Chlamydomonas reinhardtii]